MDKQLVFILAESALETIPFNKIPRDKRNLAPYQRKRHSYDVLLDASVHETFMKNLPNKEKRTATNYFRNEQRT